jgi:transcriptional antiterminator RfaH
MKIAPIPVPDTSLQHWYALYTRPRAEKKVFAGLTAKGFQAYLPLVTTLRMWSDRKKKVQLPLISSYVFVKTHTEFIYETLHVQGASGVLKFLGKPAIIRDQEIENLKILLNDPSQIETLDHIPLEKGQAVLVIAGPFKGLAATALQVQGQYRVIVELEAMGRCMCVNIPISCIAINQVKLQHTPKAALVSA